MSLYQSETIKVTYVRHHYRAPNPIKINETSHKAAIRRWLISTLCEGNWYRQYNASDWKPFKRQSRDSAKDNADKINRRVGIQPGGSIGDPPPPSFEVQLYRRQVAASGMFCRWHSTLAEESLQTVMLFEHVQLVTWIRQLLFCCPY